jgi:hypothetical protein
MIILFIIIDTFHLLMTLKILINDPKPNQTKPNQSIISKTK